MGKLLRTKKCDSGVIGLKPKLERMVSKAQGRSLWIRKVASSLLRGIGRDSAADAAQRSGAAAIALAPANAYIIKRRLK
jgi:hypothetical protein